MSAIDVLSNLEDLERLRGIHCRPCSERVLISESQVLKTCSISKQREVQSAV
jgi:DNA-directed RNA polymerase subunit RPC12/RpoP